VALFGIYLQFSLSLEWLTTTTALFNTTVIRWRFRST